MPNVHQAQKGKLCLPEHRWHDGNSFVRVLSSRELCEIALLIPSSYLNHIYFPKLCASGWGKETSPGASPGDEAKQEGGLCIGSSSLDSTKSDDRASQPIDFFQSQLAGRI